MCCRSPLSCAAKLTYWSRRRRSGRAVNIKKGQFVSPWDMRHAVEKVREAGGRASLPDRARGVVRLQQSRSGYAFAGDHAAVCSGGVRCHAFGPVAVVGEPNGETAVAQSGGQPEFIPLLSRAAVAAGVDGVFLEVHDNPAAGKIRRRQRAGPEACCRTCSIS